MPGNTVIDNVRKVYPAPDADRHQSDNSFKKIGFGEFTNIWLKDESGNPNGTHKDRLATSVLDLYFKCLYARGLEENQSVDLPQFSLISAGNAAVSIGTILKENGLPMLKVLVDENMDKPRIDHLTSSGCQVFKANLFRKPFSIEDILELTENPFGIDLTSYSNLFEINNAYESLANMILTKKPDVIISPYGTGGLFSAICNAIWDQFEKMMGERKSNPENNNHFSPYSVIGVTSFKNSRADKIHSSFSPFDNNGHRVSFYKSVGVLANDSAISCIEDLFIDKALEVLTAHNINAEPSGAAALAYLIKYKDRFDKNKRYVIINTGQGLYEKNNA